ncbi:hypothetical protein QL285_053372 [Trifolium repens]|nr:hypothetical protein QL285_053372 [Trifolium repens]
MSQFRGSTELGIVSVELVNCYHSLVSLLSQLQDRVICIDGNWKSLNPIKYTCFSLHNLSFHCNLIPFLPVVFVFTTPLLQSPTLNNKRSRINCAVMDNGGDANDVEMNSGNNDMHNEEGEEELDGYTPIDQFTDDDIRETCFERTIYTYFGVYLSRLVLNYVKLLVCICTVKLFAIFQLQQQILNAAASNQFCIGACLRDADGSVMKVYMKCLVSLL